MKLAGGQAARFCADPDPACFGVLLHGADASAVARRRRQLIAAALGDEATALAVTELGAADLRRDPGALWAAIRARGFFQGRPVVLVAGAGDGAMKAIAEAIEGATAEDALLVVTADVLPARSSLRKLFESTAGLAALQIIDEAPDAGEIAAELARRGVGSGITPEALAALAEIATGQDAGEFDQTLEIVAVFALSLTRPIEAEDIAGVAPAGTDADIGHFVNAVAGGDTAALGRRLRRLAGANVAPVALLIALERHFRMLARLSAAAQGPDRAVERVRPPLWGDRRRAVLAQTRRWDSGRLDQANRLLFATDGKVRSSGQMPDMALVERCALRLALMAGR